MNHAEFDWDFENITHLARHGVTPEEAESVFYGALLFLRTHTWSGEVRYVDVGMTPTGRILEVVTTDRGPRVRVVTAYDTQRSVAARYLSEFRPN